MGQDLYALLGVPPDADNGTLTWAYERKLAEAARTGALRRAQELAAAYEVLHSDSRRALYDRHGVSAPLQRQHPLERYAPVRAVPFRSWSPAESTVVPRPPCAPSRNGRRVAVSMAVLGALSWGAFAVAQARGAVGGAEADPVRTIRVTCPATATGPALSYSTIEGAALTCTNGATAQWAVEEAAGR